MIANIDMIKKLGTKFALTRVINKIVKGSIKNEIS